MAPLSATHVTAHFSRYEMRYDDAPPELRANLEALAHDLEIVRAAAGVPLAVRRRTIRTAERNATLPGAAEGSQHLTGDAADFDPIGITVETFLRRIDRAGILAPDGPLANAQLITYPLGSDHIHYGRPRASRSEVNTFLIQTSLNPAAPVWRGVALADSAQTYAFYKRRRGQVVLAVVIGLALLALVFFARPS